MGDYLIRFVQVHPSFRRPEIEALAELHNIDVEWVSYSEETPYAIVRLPDEHSAKLLIQRSISSKGIYELWAQGTTYADLHSDNTRNSQHRWSRYQDSSFRFDFHSFQGSVSLDRQTEVLNSFRYMGLTGPIQMRDAEQTFAVFEQYELASSVPKMIYFTRYIAPSSRDILHTYSLKTRQYINTTSMDSELALLTANMTLAAPGKLIYDPFIGTGSFPIACSHFGAVTLGSDLDGRMIRGRDGRNIMTNFEQYGLESLYLGGFVADLTHTPLRGRRWLDGIICDPPYGVREGLKVLGSKDGRRKEVVYLDGKPAHLQPNYIPPKRAYSLDAMLEDILFFAATMLVDNGRLSLWMPTSIDDLELSIPTHEALELKSSCIQHFAKWARRLLTYRRIPGVDVDPLLVRSEADSGIGKTASELNAFRKRYFEVHRRVPIQNG